MWVVSRIFRKRQMTGKELRMQEPYSEGLANHTGPESCGYAGTGKLCDSGVYVSLRLSFRSYRKANTWQMVWEPRSEPDSGNPTVRDRRDAYGNVSYGEG